MIKLHVRDNLSLSKIGEMYGVSRQRIHQLKKEYEKKHGKITRKLVLDVLTLKHYIDKGWTSKRISEHFDTSPSKISRLLKKYKEDFKIGISFINIDAKKSYNIISKDDLNILYSVKLLTDKEIADIYQVSPSTVNSLRKRYDIKSIKSKKLRKIKLNLNKEKFYELYILKKLTLSEIAKIYECNINFISELRTEYKIKKR